MCGVVAGHLGIPKHLYPWLIWKSLDVTVLRCYGVTVLWTAERARICDASPLIICQWWLHFTRISNVSFCGAFLTRIPPFTNSNSSIVKARALISFIFVIILLLLNCYTYFLSLVAQTLFVLIDNAKLRRFSSDSKKFPGFFSNLCGQSPDSWPNRVNRFKKCPM